MSNAVMFNDLVVDVMYLILNHLNPRDAWNITRLNKYWHDNIQLKHLLPTIGKHQLNQAQWEMASYILNNKEDTISIACLSCLDLFPILCHVALTLGGKWTFYTTCKTTITLLKARYRKLFPIVKSKTKKELDVYKTNPSIIIDNTIHSPCSIVNFSYSCPFINHPCKLINVRNISSNAMIRLKSPSCIKPEFHIQSIEIPIHPVGNRIVILLDKRDTDPVYLEWFEGYMVYKNYERFVHGKEEKKVLFFNPHILFNGFCGTPINIDHLYICGMHYFSIAELLYSFLFFHPRHYTLSVSVIKTYYPEVMSYIITLLQFIIHENATIPFHFFITNWTTIQSQSRIIQFTNMKLTPADYVVFVNMHDRANIKSIFSWWKQFKSNNTVVAMRLLLNFPKIKK